MTPTADQSHTAMSPPALSIEGSHGEDSSLGRKHDHSQPQRVSVWGRRAYRNAADLMLVAEVTGASVRQRIVVGGVLPGSGSCRHSLAWRAFQTRLDGGPGRMLPIASDCKVRGLDCLVSAIQILHGHRLTMTIDGYSSTP